ncbi:VOC family protein [Rhizobiaceae bacterium BDR2-2]|uniref:VOC family protein n=1 Tax=Ectorhizobium quercum TaxID=2965071 RepID=A0AAE3N227_9HYPH|nr:VOC family protein [Ectorhizobium quercum]MCX8998521.1 VOC family protein [Ectorhizobium quercum]
MQGTFIWYELLTADTVAASAFYGKVAGWEAKPAGEGDDYTLFNVPGFEMGVAGMMAITPEMACSDARPGWIGYIAVEDVDAKSAEIARAGGTVFRAPEDIPGIGRFSVAGDPHGAVFCLFGPNMPEGPLPPEPAPNTPGTFGWHELYAGAWEEDFAFYSRLFGWEKSLAVDMGPLGVYQCFGKDGEDLGGMMTATPEMGPPTWNYYINVEAIDAAAARVMEAGGKVLHGPQQVPGNAWIVNCLDPEGALFSLASMKR